MHVYKISWKMILHKWKTILLYLVIFLTLVILVDRNYSQEIEEQKVKVPVLLINEDEDSLLAEQFEDFLERYVSYSDVKIKNKSDLENHMFYESIQCVIVIPQDFTANFISRKQVTIARNHFVETDDSVVVELMINQYLSQLNKCKKQGLSIEETVKQMKKELDKEVSITFDLPEKTENNRFAQYMDYLSYALISIVMSYTGAILSQMRKEHITKRNELAPIQTNSVYKEVAFAAWSAAMIITVVLIICGLFITDTKWKSPAVILMCVNAFLYAAFCISAAFIVGIVVRTEANRELIEQIIAVGVSFLCGVFVKQSMLSKNITPISRLLPTYWFVRINNAVSVKAAVRFHEFQDFVIQAGIIICYTAVLFIISFIVTEKKVKIEL